MVAQGIAAIFFDYRSDVLVYVHNTIPTHEKPYVETIERIRATGWLNDPNDLAQQFAVVMPFLGLAWKRRSAMWNTLVVILPGLALLYGMYLTRSRGGLMGIAAVCFFALRDRVRPLTAAVMTFGTVLVLLGLSFGGGRSISTSENSAGSRLILWGDGFSMFKSHPLFGVGFGSFTEYTGQTAHNSFVLAFSELGLFGYFFWLGILVFCFAQLNQVIREASSDKPSDIEIQRWAKVLRISFATFLVTGWFLSRTYIPTLYILAALSTSLYELWRRNNPEMVYKEARLTGRRILLTGVLEVTSMIAVYVMIRSRGL